MAATTLSDIAVTKIFLHASKNYNNSIGGYLIGSRSTEGLFTICDIVPICHGNPLGPIFEIAGDFSDRQFVNPIGVVGLYFANDSCHSETPQYVNKVKQTIKANNAYCTILQIDNTKLRDAQPFLFAQSKDDKYQTEVKLDHSWDSLKKFFGDLLVKSTEQLLLDVEDHMNSHACRASDYRNIFVHDLVAAELK